MQTRTGNFPLGFRRAGGEWQQDLSTLIEWAKTNSLEVIDLANNGNTAAKTILDAGLRVGSVDLLDWQKNDCRRPKDPCRCHYQKQRLHPRLRRLCPHEPFFGDATTRPQPGPQRKLWLHG